MKVWKKVTINNNDKLINTIANSLTNYIYKYGPITNIITKYKISSEDIDTLNAYTTNRIAGLLLLYIANDVDKINDIVNKYNIGKKIEVKPEIERYLNK